MAEGDNPERLSDIKVNPIRKALENTTERLYSLVTAPSNIIKAVQKKVESQGKSNKQEH